MSSFKFPIRLAWPGACLVPLGQRDPMPSIPLGKPLTLIGSGTGVHVCLQTRTVEEFHTCVLNTDGRVYVRDLGTLEGLFVNDQRVHETVLQNNDQLRIGKMLFRFETGPTPNPGTIALPVEPAELQFADHSQALTGRTVLIGRGPRCDLRIGDDEMFEKHAMAYSADGKWHVRILTPGTKTVLNGRAVRRASLRYGDTLRLGATEFRYMQLRPRAATAVPPEPTAPAPAAPPAPAIAAAPPPVVPPAPATEGAEPVAGVGLPTQVEAFDPAALFEPTVESDRRQELLGSSLEQMDVVGSSAEDAAPLPADGQVNPDNVRSWGPVAVAMAASQRPGAALEPAATEPSRPKRRRWWFFGKAMTFAVGIMSSTVSSVTI